jgi:hypothetical protein
MAIRGKDISYIQQQLQNLEEHIGASKIIAKDIREFIQTFQVNCKHRNTGLYSSSFNHARICKNCGKVMNTAPRP